MTEVKNTDSKEVKRTQSKPEEAKFEPATTKMVSNSSPMVEESSKKESIVYVGPSLKSGLVKNTVFNNGIPSYVSDKFEDTPELEELFVPVSDFPAALADLKIVGTPLYLANIIVQKKGVF